jgi:hypothetical protein
MDREMRWPFPKPPNPTEVVGYSEKIRSVAKSPSEPQVPTHLTAGSAPRMDHQSCTPAPHLAAWGRCCSWLCLHCSSPGPTSLRHGPPEPALLCRVGRQSQRHVVLATEAAVALQCICACVVVLPHLAPHGELAAHLRGRLGEIKFA